MKSPYQVLGVSENASEEEVKKAYRKLWPISKEIMEELYSNQKIPMEKIAEIFNTNSGTISYYIKKYKIKIVESWERLNTPHQISEREKDIVLGYVLGDGCISRNCKYAHLRVSQSAKQIEFVNQLYEELKPWASYEPKKDKRYDIRHGKSYHTIRFDTYMHPEFNKLYDICYMDGKKTVNEKWLESVGEIGIAMWYQGDGGLSNKGKTPLIHTNSFDISEQNMLKKWLKNKFDISSEIIKKGKYSIIKITSVTKFSEIIRKNICADLTYKIPTCKCDRGRSE